MNKNILKIATDIISIIVSLYFSYILAYQFLNFKEFSSNLFNQPIPVFFKHWLKYFLVGLESLILVFLVIERVKVWTYFVAAAFFLGLSIYIVMILGNFFNKIPCSCVMGLSKLSWKQNLFVQLLMMAFSVLLIVSQLRLVKNKQGLQKT